MRGGNFIKDLCRDTEQKVALVLCKVIKIEGTVATELLLTLGFMQTRNTKVKLVDLRVRIGSDNMRRPAAYKQHSVVGECTNIQTRDIPCNLSSACLPSLGSSIHGEDYP